MNDFSKLVLNYIIIGSNNVLELHKSFYCIVKEAINFLNIKRYTKSLKSILINFHLLSPIKIIISHLFYVEIILYLVFHAI